MNVTYFVLYGTCHLDELFPTRCFCSKPMNSLSLADERVHVEFFRRQGRLVKEPKETAVGQSFLQASPRPGGDWPRLGTLHGEYSVRSVSPLTPTRNGT